MLFFNSYQVQLKSLKLHLIIIKRKMLESKVRILTGQILSMKMILSSKWENRLKVLTLKWIFLKISTTNQVLSSQKMASINQVRWSNNQKTSKRWRARTCLLSLKLCNMNTSHLINQAHTSKMMTLTHLWFKETCQPQVQWTEEKEITISSNLRMQETR